MKYTVIFHHTEEGISVSVSGLQGRWSEGDTGEEKFENIQNAIQEYLAAAPSVDLPAHRCNPGGFFDKSLNPKMTDNPVTCDQCGMPLEESDFELTSRDGIKRLCCEVPANLHDASSG